MKAFITRHWFFIVLICTVLLLAKPLVISQQIPFSSNLLASFFNPWAQEKFPGWQQGIPNKPVGIDDLRIFYPQRKFTIAMEKHFQIPFWNPYNFSGNYHAALSETAVFYPLFSLFLFLPQLPTWVFLQLCEPVIASIGMYLFLRYFFTKKIPAVFGALVFGFSGILLVRMVEGLSVGHTIIWLPFALWGLVGFSQKKQFRFLLVATIALCLSLLAGWFQYTFYTVSLSFLFALFLFLQHRVRKNLLLFVPFVLFPLLTLFHIVPAFEMMLVSSRSATTTQELLNLHLMPWYHLLTFLSPDFWGNPGTYNFFGKSEYKESIVYIGVIPFFVSLFSFGFVKNKIIWFFTGVSLVGLLLGIDTPVTRMVLSLPLPLVSSFLPNRIFILTTFGLSVLSAYGLLYLLEAKKLSKALLVFVIFLAGVLFILANGYVLTMNFLPERFAADHTIATVYAFFQHLTSFTKQYAFTNSALELSIFTKNLLLPDIFLVLFVLLLLLRFVFKKKLFIIGIFILTILGQLYFAQKYLPWSQMQFVFPQHPVFTYLQQHQGIDRFVSLGTGYIPSEIPLYFGLYSPDGVGSMYMKRYGELVTYVQQKGKTGQIPRIEIRINPTTQSLFEGKDFYMLRFLQIDGVRYVVKLRNETAPEGMKTNGTNVSPLVWENKTWQIFQYPSALPRVFWTNQYTIQTADKKILKTMFTSSNPKEIVLEKSPLLAIASQAVGSVHVINYLPQSIVLTTKATGNGLVFLSDAYTPNFHVTVDGKSTPLLRADYAFRAIAVPKGEHTVVLSYEDNKELIAFLISGGSIVALCLGIAYLFKNRYL